MKTNLVYSEKYERPGYGVADIGTVERLEYECPCGKGKIVEEHSDIPGFPGFHEHDVYIRCKKCSENYRIDKSQGVCNWQLIEINKEV